jgi:ParB-like chromosome segregation protein Spo0J
MVVRLPLMRRKADVIAASLDRAAPEFDIAATKAGALRHSHRTHSPEQVAQIAASIREWGWIGPLLALRPASGYHDARPEL